jgi:hypothetical protein
MSRTRNPFLLISLPLHAAAAIALLLLIRETRAMAGVWIVTGVLIACAAVPTQPGRPITLYAAFGAFLAYAFWLAVSAINQGQYIEVLPAVLIGIGAAWLLQSPEWPAVLFAGAAAGLCLVGIGVVYYRRYDFPQWDLDTLRRTLLTTYVFLGIGVCYLIHGWMEIKLQPRRKKMKRMVIRTPRE